MLSQAAKSLVRGLATATSSVNNVAIIGAGYMGTGIAQVAAKSGFNVTLVDKDKSQLAQSTKHISGDLSGRIKTATTLADAVKDADLVVEVIDENKEDKSQLFADLDKNAKSNAIFATNTASIRFTELAKNVKRRDRFAGLCFDDPVDKTQSVTVFKLPESSEQTVQTLLDFGKRLGKSANIRDASHSSSKSYNVGSDQDLRKPEKPYVGGGQV
jgi:3-hydroxyacyl-CoA dehydrogenase